VENGVPRAIGRHGAAIRAWFGADLEDMTRYDLAPATEDAPTRPAGA
jgi:N-acyl homoserine lactone hydrolase